MSNAPLPPELRLTWEIWDRTSPINGVPAETMLARPDVSDGEVYLIRDETGRVVVFQPHEPHVAGLVKMSKARAQTVAAAHVAEVVNARAERVPGA